MFCFFVISKILKLIFLLLLTVVLYFVNKCLFNTQNVNHTEGVGGYNFTNDYIIVRYNLYM